MPNYAEHLRSFPILSCPRLIISRLFPQLSGVPQRLTWCQKVGLRVLPKWGDGDFCPLKKAVFRCFFLLDKFFRPNGRLSPTACHTFLESLWISGQFQLSGNHFSASYEALYFCWQIGLNFLQHLRPCHMVVIVIMMRHVASLVLQTTQWEIWFMGPLASFSDQGRSICRLTRNKKFHNYFRKRFFSTAYFRFFGNPI